MKSPDEKAEPANIRRSMLYTSETDNPYTAPPTTVVARLVHRQFGKLAGVAARRHVRGTGPGLTPFTLRSIIPNMLSKADDLRLSVVMSLRQGLRLIRGMRRALTEDGI